MAFPLGDEPKSRIESAALQLVYLLGLAAVASGVYVLRDTDIGSSAGDAISAAASQLTLTVPPAAIVLVLAALNIAAGAVLVRTLAGKPFGGAGQAALCGLAGALLLDTALMATAGLVGLFIWPVLAIVNVAVIAAGWRLRPILAPGWASLSRLPALGLIGWALVIVVWSAPALLQLASPFVPSNDVPPNHVAPVEHLRTFGSLSALDVVVSPVYGASRIFLGYQGLLGAIATTGNVPAGSAASSFILPLVILLAVAGCGLARAMGGRTAQAWALLLVPLTVPFLRISDARATVLATPLALLALWLLIEPLGERGRRQAAVLAVVIAAAIYAHPMMGLFTAGTVGMCWLVWPRDYGPSAIAAAIAAPILALPQWAAMAGVSWAGATALIAVPLAMAVLLTLTSARFERTVSGRAPLLIVVASLVFATLVLAVFAPQALGDVINGAAALPVDYTVLIAVGVLGLLMTVIAYRRGDRGLDGVRVLVAGVVVGLLAASVGIILSHFAGLGSGLAYEVPKGATYFVPTMLAVIGAAGVAAIWTRRSIVLPVRFVIAALVLVIAAAPIRSGVVLELSLGEHRLAESMSISLGIAARGYWLGFPDVRQVIDPEQAELIDALRTGDRCGPPGPRYERPARRADMALRRCAHLQDPGGRVRGRDRDTRCAGRSERLEYRRRPATPSRRVGPAARTALQVRRRGQPGPADRCAGKHRGRRLQADLLQPGRAALRPPALAGPARASASDALDQRVGHDQAVDLVGALVDLGALGVAHVALDGELARVAAAAEELDGVRGHAHGRVRCRPLGQRRNLADGLAAVLGLCRGAREGAAPRPPSGPSPRA